MTEPRIAVKCIKARLETTKHSFSYARYAWRFFVSCKNTGPNLIVRALIGTMGSEGLLEGSTRKNTLIDPVTTLTFFEVKFTC